MDFHVQKSIFQKIQKGGEFIAIKSSICDTFSTKFFYPTMFLDQNIVLNSTFFWTKNFFQHEIFLDKHFFWLKMFLNPKFFFETENFWIQIFFGTKHFLVTNFFLLFSTSKLLLNRILPNLNCSLFVHHISAKHSEERL